MEEVAPEAASKEVVVEVTKVAALVVTTAVVAMEEE